MKWEIIVLLIIIFVPSIVFIILIYYNKNWKKLKNLKMAIAKDPENKKTWAKTGRSYAYLKDEIKNLPDDGDRSIFEYYVEPLETSTKHNNTNVIEEEEEEEEEELKEEF